MATWQHPFRVRPTPGADSDKLAARLDSILTSGSGWSTEILQWGDIDATVFELDLDDQGAATEALFRLDLRGEWREELAAVWEACADAGYQFFTIPDGAPVNTLGEAMEIVAASNAARFVRDPHGFLDELGTNGPGDKG